MYTIRICGTDLGSSSNFVNPDVSLRRPNNGYTLRTDPMGTELVDCLGLEYSCIAETIGLRLHRCDLRMLSIASVRMRKATEKRSQACECAVGFCQVKTVRDSEVPSCPGCGVSTEYLPHHHVSGWESSTPRPRLDDIVLLGRGTCTCRQLLPLKHCCPGRKILRNACKTIHLLPAVDV